MYLKSLILKGFKSFADKSVLTLEPGITAIVGPNGSGKSNISDAVLWVLGERSARNLRGQAMEDIIFSGSAARKAVSVAEVDLVLDNSDKTLPVDFDEVVITRKMYRSGESEYLVNGVVSRRLDVLDILHDTGLGTGTHSIISQGSLDSILHSKPEDRRNLIEEAAGVLKHKQRKEKSARKLQSMDNHLLRVRDVAAEVSRSLGPLERKAKRAETYKEVSAELSSLVLALAVDDLRKLQASWEEICAKEKSALEVVENQRVAVEAAERRVNEVQELMRQESDDATTLARRQRKAMNLIERTDSVERLLRERRRSALESQSDLKTSLETDSTDFTNLNKELDSLKDSLEAMAQELELAQAKTQEVANEKGAKDERLRILNQELEALNQELIDNQHQGEEAQRKRLSLQESLSDGLAQMKLVEVRKDELSSELTEAEKARDAAEALATEAENHLKDLLAAEEKLKSTLAEAFNERESAQETFDEARSTVASTKSAIEALEAAIRTSAEEDPALLWLLDQNSEAFGDLKPLASWLKVDSSLEALVEALLGEDLALLPVASSRVAQEIVSSLRPEKNPGDVSLWVSGLEAANFKPSGEILGQPLLDLLRYPASMADAVEALLSDVYVVDTLEEALEASSKSSQGLRFISRDGCALWPNGRLRIFGPRDSSDDTVLGRARRLDEAKESKAEAEEALKRAKVSLDAAEEIYRKAQTESLDISQKLAAAKGAADAAQADFQRTKERFAALTEDFTSINESHSKAKATVDELRPAMASVDELLDSLSKKKVARESRHREATEALKALQEEAAALTETYSNLRLEETKLGERKVYQERMVATRQGRIQALEEAQATAKKAIAEKSVAMERSAALLDIFSILAKGLAAKGSTLNAALDATEEATTKTHSQAGDARQAARNAHDSYDQASQAMASIQVEKSRLEVQVDAAVQTVVRDCETPLEIADTLPPLENRQEAEDQRFRLERRIKAMGPINPDAAQEYAELKERYDYLAGQLEDIEAARRSLNRIVRVIDERMRDDFLQTFEEVNQNFGEIFAVLFPGGQASLSFVDPSDIETSGVEVSAQPRGKRLSKMSLMSGGEKSLTALALLFAVYRTRSTPFYILDEVEAALDDTNLRRLMAYIDTLRSTTQLIMITHQRRTMEMADVLFGVSMQADGVTRVISQKLERALEHAQED